MFSILTLKQKDILIWLHKYNNKIVTSNIIFRCMQLTVEKVKYVNEIVIAFKT